jgi:drug/metabolite transporter (DMT)-like permease
MNTFGFTRADGRNLLVVAGIVGAVTAVTTVGSPAVQIASGVLAGLISGVVFTVSTVLINRYKPDHW